MHARSASPLTVSDSDSETTSALSRILIRRLSLCVARSCPLHHLLPRPTGSDRRYRPGSAQNRRYCSFFLHLAARSLSTLASTTSSTAFGSRFSMRSDFHRKICWSYHCRIQPVLPTPGQPSYSACRTVVPLPGPCGSNPAHVSVRWAVPAAHRLRSVCHRMDRAATRAAGSRMCLGRRHTPRLSCRPVSCRSRRDIRQIGRCPWTRAAPGSIAGRCCFMRVSRQWREGADALNLGTGAVSAAGSEGAARAFGKGRRLRVPEGPLPPAAARRGGRGRALRRIPSRRPRRCPGRAGRG